MSDAMPLTPDQMAELQVLQTEYADATVSAGNALGRGDIADASQYDAQAGKGSYNEALSRALHRSL